MGRRPKRTAAAAAVQPRQSSNAARADSIARPQHKKQRGDTAALAAGPGALLLALGSPTSDALGSSDEETAAHGEAAKEEGDEEDYSEDDDGDLERMLQLESEQKELEDAREEQRRESTEQVEARPEPKPRPALCGAHS